MQQPTILGKYDILERIGRGAMGEVYKARDGVLKRTVAVKTIATALNLSPDHETLMRFRREAQSAAGLNHPNIVTVFDFGEMEGSVFLVMELLEGVDLSEIVKRRLVPDLDAKLDLMRQVASGVAFAHSHNVVHRDLKPANIRVLPDGLAKIMDFGLARTHQTELTPTGRLLGTPHYMAPEQVRGLSADQRSDVFSLGVIFYELLTGQRPFPAPDIHAVLFQILQRQPDSVRTLDPGLPGAFDTVLLKAMAKNPLERYKDAGELLAALRSLDAADAGLSDSRGGGEPSAAAAPSELTTASLPDTAVTVVGEHAPLSSSGRLEAPAVVTFLHEEGGARTLEVTERQTTVLEAALAHDVPLFHECGGRARCSTCRVRVRSGHENVQPRTPQESRLANRLGWGADIRLACQTRLTGDVELERLVRDDYDVGLLLGEQSQAVTAQETALAVMSARIQDLGTIANRAPPYDLIHILNRFFLQIGEPVVALGGRIQGYSGSGFRAFFGLDGGSARKKCLAAVQAALRCAARMEPVNRYTGSYFSTELCLGIGLHFGRMIVGQLGHPSKRELSTIDDLPWRICDELAGRNETGGTSILATEELINVVEDDLRLGLELPDQIVAGRQATVYEVMDLADPDPAFTVQRTFEKLEARREEAAETFYSILFELAPGVRELFRRDPRTQGQMFMSMLSTTVKGLDDIDSVERLLKDLGERHVGYGARLQHYDVVEHALLETVRRIRGEEELDPAVRLAWTEIYGDLVRIMTEDLPPESAEES